MCDPAHRLNAIERDFERRWLEAMPHLAAGGGTPGPERGWPDWSETGRAYLAGLLRDTSAGLDASVEDPPSPEARRCRLLLERELREIEAAPGPARVIQALAAGLAGLLDPAAERDPDSTIAERLRGITVFIDSLLPGLRAAPPEDRREALPRLEALCKGLEASLAGRRDAGRPVMDPQACDAALRRLRELARELDHAGEAVHPSEVPDTHEFARAWRLAAGRGLEPESLLAEFQNEIGQVSEELFKRSGALHAKYAGRSPGGPAGLRFVLEQLGQDRPLPERWLEEQRSRLAELRRWAFSRRLLYPPAPSFRLEMRPPWCDPSGDYLMPELRAGESKEPPIIAARDLAQLPRPVRESHLGDCCHYALSVLLAREALPGRAFLLYRRRSEGGVCALLSRPENLDAWAQLVPQLLLDRGWFQGEPRLRIMVLREKLRDMHLARADLELHTGLRPSIELKRRLVEQALVPRHLAEEALREIRRRPGRAALAAARALELRKAERRWRRRRGAEAGNADALDLAARYADLPLTEIARGLPGNRADGRALAEPPPPVIRIPRPEKDAAVREAERRLAELGRITREDLSAGSEFDASASGGEELTSGT